MTEPYETLEMSTEKEKGLVEQALQAHADLMWDEGFEEELEIVEELMDQL